MNKNHLAVCVNICTPSGRLGYCGRFGFFFLFLFPYCLCCQPLVLPSPCRGSSFAATLRANLNLTPLNSKTKEKGQPTKSTKRQREGENKQPSRHVTWNIKKLKTRLCFSPESYHLGFAFNSWTRWLFKMRLYIPSTLPARTRGHSSVQAAES